MPLRSRGVEWQLSPQPLDVEKSSEILAPPGERPFGAADRAVISEGGIALPDEIEIRIASCPVVASLKDVFLENGRKPSVNQLKIYRGYDLWVVIHGLSVLKRRGPARVLSLEYRAEHPEAATVDLFPSQQFAKLGEFSAKAELDVNVEAGMGLPEGISDALEWTEWCGGRVKASGASGLAAALRLRFSIQRLVIEAVGRRSRFCHWVLRPDADHTLFGDHVLVQTLRVPIHTTSVTATLTVGAEVKDWYEIKPWTSVTPFIWTQPLTVQLAPHR